MSTQDEKLAAVTTGVENFAVVETALDALEGQFDDLLASLKDVYSLGVGRQVEYLEITNRIKYAKGQIAGTLATVVSVHARCTEIAKRENCDVVIPTAFAIGDVSTQSGTR